MNMFDFIAVSIVGIHKALVETAASLSGYTRGDGEHNRCASSDEVAHCEDTYSRFSSVLMIFELLVAVLGNNGGMGTSVSDKSSVEISKGVAWTVKSLETEKIDLSNGADEKERLDKGSN